MNACSFAIVVVEARYVLISILCTATSCTCRLDCFNADDMNIGIVDEGNWCMFRDTCIGSFEIIQINSYLGSFLYVNQLISLLT